MTDILVVLAGLTQLAIALTSLLIPRVLDWKAEVAQLSGLTRRIFWTYAGYILGTNIAFGLVSVLAAHWLTDGTDLARAVCAFIATYWGARIVVQFAAYGEFEPKGRKFVVAKLLYMSGFAYCTGVYGAIALALV